MTSDGGSGYVFGECQKEVNHVGAPHLTSDCIPYMPGILTMSGEQDAPPCAGMGNAPHSSISSALFLLVLSVSSSKKIQQKIPNDQNRSEWYTDISHLEMANSGSGLCLAGVRQRGCS